MIATIVYQGMEASLKDDGTWSSRSKKLATVLNKKFNPEIYLDGPADGRSAQAIAAAKELKARLRWAKKHNDHPNRVY